ncbi:hypothetical protein H5S09_06915 [Limosilactobacillus sp. STM2_1]|uniref:Rad50/SbcC-type AAA domain-containing protein n=1 Tax=Limosilactobacillus rudii TaxID=2759755 RepID=A0A7W3ULG8_9LACO|nr:hypothetical protein [Limosilactobacillus rudii]MBB1078777.1 hypothetical protein [Limosilactobacillus rudii]MBB1097671.1 hypothetical protein [Limosilactobacillus rudii]MCD7134779.1 hypothetical protein [Limosilactobacillus rudii]
MKIKELEINGKKFNFENENTFIFSHKNSTGKTTLLRCLLYSFGYNVPSTKGIRFDNLEIKLFYTSNNKEFCVYRRNNFITISDVHDTVYSMNIKQDQNNVLSIIYGINNPLILDNILGLHYFDQEKGWTLLNRGIVIGSIHFKIEDLIEGLGEVNISKFNIELKKLNDERKFYKQFLKLLEVQKEYEYSEYKDTDESTKSLTSKLRFLNIEKAKLNREIKEYLKIKNNNSKLLKFIDNSGIRIRTKSGDVERVTQDNIVGYKENQGLIDAQIERKKRYEYELQKEILNIQGKLNDKLKLVNIEDQLSKLNGILSSLATDEGSINEIINQHTTKISEINKKIKEVLYRSKITQKIYERVLRYSNILGVRGSIDGKSDFIYTSNLKRYSGAKLHLLVFAFKLALLKEVQNKIRHTLPIILDSPMTGELDYKNLKKMFKLLALDFKKNQVIVSSIYDLDAYYKWNKKIELKNRMLE